MSVENELKHHGVLGMKWGVRRARTSTGKSDSGPSKKTQRLHQKVKSLEERAKTWEGSIKDKKGKTVLSEKEVKDIQNQILKKAEKTKIKAIKSEYADEYLRGKTPVGKAIAKILDTPTSYAEVMYNIDNSNMYAKYKK